MLTRHKPEIGVWYENTEQGEIFEVVAIDEEAGFVATQYFDGAVASLDTETFVKMPLRIAPQPEDWSGPFELDSNDNEIDNAEPRDQWQAYEEFDEDNLRLSEQ